MKRLTRILAIAIACISSMCLTSCESCQREFKSFKSDLSGGLYRKVTVYDYSGKEIKSWQGKFDVQETSSDYVYFDMPDGRRVVVHGGILINEEIIK